MSKISEQLESLKLSINSIKDKMQKVRIENALLLKQQTGLVTEKSELIKKNELAREEIESVLERIKKEDKNSIKINISEILSCIFLKHHYFLFD